MRHFGILCFSALLLAASGCATKATELPVRVDVNHEVDFRALKTFRPAAEMAEEAQAYPKLQRLAKNLVIEELISRGYQRLEDGTPDFRLRSHLRFNSYRSRKMGASKTTGETTMKADDQREVTLIVEIIGARDGKVYWSGFVSGFHLDPINAGKTLKAAARRLLREFPPLF